MMELNHQQQFRQQQLNDQKQEDKLIDDYN